MRVTVWNDKLEFYIDVEKEFHLKKIPQNYIKTQNGNFV